MNVTSLFVEIVVSGIHTLIWVGLIALGFTGYQNLDFEKLLGINLALPALALGYILGIIMDRLADTVFMTQGLRLRDAYRDSYFKKDEISPSFLTMRFYILNKSSDMYEQLEYTRSRLRIARTAILNFSLTTLALLLFTWLQFSTQLTTLNLITIELTIALVGSLLTYLSYRAWVGLTLNYSISTFIAYRVIRETEENNVTTTE